MPCRMMPEDCGPNHSSSLLPEGIIAAAAMVQRRKEVSTGCTAAPDTKAELEAKAANICKLVASVRNQQSKAKELESGHPLF